MAELEKRSKDQDFQNVLYDHRRRYKTELCM